MGTHLIHRQILDLRYYDEGRAKAAMNLWNDRFQQVWVPVMLEVLDELDTDGKWIRLDRVEIDLGKIRENLSPDLFRQKLKEALKTQLLKQIRGNQISRPTQEKSEFLFPQDERKSLEILDYLLRNGRKPWWASHSKKEGIRSLIQKLLEEKSRELLAWLQSESITPVMLFRLEQHLKWDEILKLISFAFPEKLKESLALSESLLSSLSPETYLKIELDQKLEGHILEAFLFSESKLSHPISKWFKVHLNKSTTSKIAPEAYSALLAELIPASFRTISAKQVLENVWAKWTQTPSFKKASPNSETQAKSQQLAKVKFLDLVNANSVESKSSTSDSIKKATQTLPSEKLTLDETILISNSGLVLTAPFLPFFFKGLGLVEKKQFVSPESQNRAVLLLQALVNDSFEYEESDLLLNKILCGMEPSEPIAVSFSPTETEKEEIKNLLDSMVSHWTALKSTSGLSMAKGFFPREGSLRRADKGYQLHIPRISIDILLNRLPWTISIIKLPWMNETLFTEW
ncbi:contractile injection system tape measure protein [Algoriphagus sp. A40]|uniref:contractile injection system tape measure protein n=1 Tax=Algoriphagus sp. A40 TaxID=1945863 RepID=UPI0009848AA0|nr:contractile injection system tape measure protein [Algoriphagus sp. A40]OOG70725.1 hypothetical protein B0E43_19290 [Algoriphagus sp. A40]